MDNKLKALEELGKLGKEWIKKYGNPSQTLLIDSECIGVSGIDLYLPLENEEGV